MKNKNFLEEHGVAYEDNIGFDYNGCPSTLGLTDSKSICHPSGDGCGECQNNAFEEIWFGEPMVKVQTVRNMIQGVLSYIHTIEVADAMYKLNCMLDKYEEQE